MDIETGSRARTRQAIIDAAIEVFARNPASTLGDVATAAGVGRTTLHRYFAERGDLVVALRREAADRLHRAHERARLAEGTGAEAVRRLCQEYFDLGDVLSLLFSEQVLADGDTWHEVGDCAEDFEAMVRRGHDDGTVDRGLPADWISSLVWSQLYAGWSYIGEHQVSRHEALRLILRSIEGALAPR
ncbi:TetR/AcrR family transcriptional regulator [Couchioplanes caeruleus]|uniref:TetR family transcriptional regulator n=2 Tax=Couchioplanes caeruleus TaxID=56438 RepID=A0A1K0FKF9_9ACTN|nr:TetR/AcrR family transcriptional regulator [Couchioplanes caeruleus]OJF13224.1 TetR family transcriptional regulator [Couchioplanes caeruleus subsp. caeruleus]ROP27790.1 TetR family transcriptional regulator [Couchioplanes caeruleus]